MPRDLTSAIEDFRRARSQATLEQIVARLTGESDELLCYEDVRQKLKATGAQTRGLQEIPLDAIVGSVGRCSDFTRSFLPRQDENEERWARIELAMTRLSRLPPIKVYQVGQVYFVLDGNHRVSVARRLGATHISAYVTEVFTRVTLTPKDRPDDLIIKAEYADFLEHTRLDELRPQADLSVSVPGQYQKLEERVEAHRYFMGIGQEREIPHQEAVVHWYDEAYLPVVEIIRERDALRDFPARTEADLYLWLSEHHATLERELGWAVRPEIAADDLIARSSPRLKRALARLRKKLQSLLVPEKITPGPPPGEWRRGWTASRQATRLFTDILVPVSRKESGWSAVEQAIEIARREKGRLLGLHVVSAQPERESEAVQAIRAQFDQRCKAAGVPGKLIVKEGEIASKICERSRWASLVVVNLAHPPGDQPIARLSSGFRALIERCLSPVLAVPQAPSRLSRALLAYDGSPKAEEALFVSTYLAGQWDIPLVVVAVLEKERAAAQTLTRAQKYLEEHGVQATFVEQRGPVGEAILETVSAHGCNLIVMGGYGFSPVLEIVLGSAVDQVLRESQQPVLICR
jgi:nucleotide-binding universal stress UspA family protein